MDLTPLDFLKSSGSGAFWAIWKEGKYSYIRNVTLKLPWQEKPGGSLPRGKEKGRQWFRFLISLKPLLFWAWGNKLEHVFISLKNQYYTPLCKFVNTIVKMHPIHFVAYILTGYNSIHVHFSIKKCNFVIFWVSQYHHRNFQDKIITFFQAHD